MNHEKPSVSQHVKTDQTALIRALYKKYCLLMIKIILVNSA